MNILIQQLNTLWRLRELLQILTIREIKARHTGTLLGLFWPYIQPIATIAAYYLVFDLVFAMKLSKDAPIREVGAFLVVGVLPWMAFCDAISRGMNSLLEAGDLLKKNALPPLIFPLKATLASIAIYAPLIIFVSVIYNIKIQTTYNSIWIIYLLLFQSLLMIQFSFALAISAAALRDVIQISNFMLSIGIYLSPALFPLNIFPANWQWLLWLNPMTPFIVAYQDILLSGNSPSMQCHISITIWIVISFITTHKLVIHSQENIIDWL